MTHQIVLLLLRRGRGLVLVNLIVLLAVARAAQPPVTDLLDQAQAAFEQRYQPAQLSQALSIYESLLPQLEALSREQRALILNRLSQLYYEAAEYDGGQGDANRTRYEQGKAFGLQSLALNAQFKAQRSRDFAAALRAVTDPAALTWTADNWGTLLGFLGLSGASQLGDVRALYERCLQVDETFWGASCHNALGALLATTPSFLGGDFQSAQDHLNRALELAPDYLTNHTALAEFVGFSHNLFGKIDGVRDRALIERELNLVLEAKIGQWPFWNRLAKRKAQELLKKLDELGS